MIHIWYLIPLFSVLGFSLISVGIKTDGDKLNKVDVNEKYLAFVLISIIPLIYVATTRSMSIGDTRQYVDIFKSVPTSLSELVSYIKNRNIEYLYSVYEFLIKLISSDAQFYFFITATIQLVSVAIFFMKYSTTYMLSWFFFIASGAYFSWTCNGIRQFLAVVIVVSATPLFLKKKYLLSILVIIIASMFHSTAIIMIPIIFICNGEPWNKKTLLFIVATIVVILFIDRFTDFLDESAFFPSYQGKLSQVKKSGDDGTHPLRVLVESVPMVLSLFLVNKNEERNVFINFAINASIVSSMIYIVSMLTSGVLIGRLPGYLILYSYALLCYEIKVLFSGKLRIFIYFGVILLYLMFYFYQFRNSIFG